MISLILLIVNLMVTFIPLRYVRNINSICTRAVFIMHVTKLIQHLAMIVDMLPSLCPHRSKKYSPYQLFIKIHYCILIGSIPPYLHKCNTINTTNLFRQTLHVFHYDCKPILITSMDNKGIKVTYDHSIHINELTQILYFLVTTNDLSFVFIRVKATFVVSKIIFIRT